MQDIRVSTFDPRSKLYSAGGVLQSDELSTQNILLMWPTPLYLAQNVLPCAWHDEILTTILNQQIGENLKSSWLEKKFFDQWPQLKKSFLEFLSAHIRSFLSWEIPQPFLDSISWTDEMWPNLRTGQDWHSDHLHERSTLSFVYYFSTNTNSRDVAEKMTSQKANGSLPPGVLQFSDPRGSAPYMTHELPSQSFFNRGKFIVSPVEGQLIIFPSYLVHMVAPSLSDVPRVSVAGNIHSFKGVPK
jgi:hypothetical protein